jgi:quercetin dioxygenase-like cupin family protein
MRWLFDAERAAGANMTLGVVEIEAGRENDRHQHDCEEVLLLLAGELEHELDGRWLKMRAGDAIRIPKGTPHQARNVGSATARMVVAYNAGRRGFQLVPRDAR